MRSAHHNLSEVVDVTITVPSFSNEKTSFFETAHSLQFQGLFGSISEGDLMTKTFRATLDGEVFRPEEAVELPTNTVVDVTITVPALADGKRSFLETARSLQLQGPPDWSERLDEYLYGDVEAREIS
jgi:hypothetical protein